MGQGGTVRGGDRIVSVNLLVFIAEMDSSL